MNTDGSDDGSFVRDKRKLKTMPATQLSLAISAMHHIDELLRWLSYVTIRNFNVQLVQCWANHIDQDGRPTVQMRSLIRHDASFPESLVINESMTLIAQHIIHKQISSQPQPIETLFPPYQSILLKRYGIHYCGACFTHRNAFLPPPENVLHQEHSPVLLAISTMLMLRQFPRPDLIPMISSLFDQAFAIAEQHDLLIAHTTVTPSLPALAPQFSQVETRFTIEQLIPRRKQDANFLLVDNPFVGKIIADKRVRSLYSAIDGRTNIATLAESTGMTVKETYEALQKLRKQNRAELFQPDGQVARNPPTLNTL